MSKTKPKTLTVLLKVGLTARYREVSLRQIGRETGIPQPVISRFLNGGRALSLRHAETLCSYLGIVHVVEKTPTPLHNEAWLVSPARKRRRDLRAKEKR